MLLNRQPVAGSIEELIGPDARRSSMDKHVDSLSGSAFERVEIDGVAYVLKHVSYQSDWLARALDDRRGWVARVWETGLMSALPPQIDPAIVGVAREADDRVAVLMRDVSAYLVPPGSAPLPVEQHLGFLSHMAAMHARFWGFTDSYGLMPAANRYSALTPATAAREAAAGHTDPVPAALPGGWAALAAAEPEAYRLSLALATDPTRLVRELDKTPATLVHGDWKAGNLGTTPDGRTVLLDWGWPGRAAPLADLAWYLAVNCERLPIDKSETIEAYHGFLRRAGIETAAWWDHQLELALLGGFLQLGWSKARDPDELQWWVRRVVPVARQLE